MFYHSDGLVHHVIEKSAYDRAIEAFKAIRSEREYYKAKPHKIEQLFSDIEKVLKELGELDE